MGGIESRKKKEEKKKIIYKIVKIQIQKEKNC